MTGGIHTKILAILVEDFLDYILKKITIVMAFRIAYEMVVGITERVFVRNPKTHMSNCRRKY